MNLSQVMLILDMVTLKDSSLRRGTAVITSPNGDVTIRIRTRPLPQSITDFLLKHSESIKQLFLDRRGRIEDLDDVTIETVSVGKRLTFEEFRKELEALLVGEGGEWKSVIDRCSLFHSNLTLESAPSVQNGWVQTS